MSTELVKRSWAKQSNIFSNIREAAKKSPLYGSVIRGGEGKGRANKGILKNPSAKFRLPLSSRGGGWGVKALMALPLKKRTFFVTYLILSIVIIVEWGTSSLKCFGYCSYYDQILDIFLFIYTQTVWCNQMGAVLAEMSSWTRHLWMKTTF